MGELEDWGRERPLFNVNEAERQLRMERDSLKEKLSRMTRRGDLERVERGKYTFHEDPMVYATYVERPSYISLWSGLRFYNVTTQQPSKVQVVAPVNREDLEKVDFHRSKEMFGFEKRNYSGFEISVAERERLLIDCLYYRDVPVTELVELVEEVDVDRTLEYAERFGVNSVKKRVGYLIEKVKGDRLEELRPEDRNYPLLDLTKTGGREKDRYWRLEVNADVE
ncbi:MAG: hypothetical protein SVS85_01430 [Candidatus Nanohaloarchaea archaeon]|nr:hypothetical protein [Candidatus Nanohaloarchaea archaeon]